jgi:ubiquinone/menaquinone biosynthesis C-methylase UbiE
MFDLTQTDQFKRLVRASFDNTNPSYGTEGDFHWQFASRLIAYTPIQSGQTVVDVATGTAPAAILAAPSVGNLGRVVALDLSVGILTLAQHNIATAGITNIVLLCGDAESLPLRDAQVDGLICSSAIVWLPNIVRALHDWYRVLRPGGWLVFSCFGGLARQTVIGLLGRLLQPYGQQLPELNAPLNTPEKCQQMLATAGYTNVTVHRGQDRPLPTTAEESFAWAWASRSRFNITLAPEQVTEVQARYIVEFMQIAADQEQWNHDYEQYVVAYK